jgi:hypothetical protein
MPHAINMYGGAYLILALNEWYADFTFRPSYPVPISYKKAGYVPEQVQT